MNINWDASLTAKHRALEIVAEMLADEYPEMPVSEIVASWGPVLSETDLALVREVFPGGDGP